jgi:hypothetical protein
MSQFEAARAKYEKNRISQARPLPKVDVPKKEEPKPVVSAPKVEPMTIRISGPVELTLLIDYQGTLLSSQQNEQALLALFKKCLLPIGRVR